MKKMKKKAIQIYLEPEQEKIISALSKAKGRAKASIIRECISRFIDNLSLEEDPALNIINLGTSGKKDIAKRHDDYLVSTTQSEAQNDRKKTIR